MNGAWQTPRNLKLLFVAALLMLFANALVPWMLLQRQVEHQRQVEQTVAIQEALAQILSYLLDAETGERGFIITGADTFLAPYNNALQTIPQHMTRLRELTADNTAQRERFDRLSSLISAKLRELDNIIELRKREGMEAARALITGGTSKRNMDQLRIEIDNIDNGLEVEQSRHAENVQQAAQYATFGFAAIALLNGLLFVVFYNLLVNRYGRRLDAIIASAMDGFIAIDENQRIVLFNPAAEKMFGRSARDMIGAKLDRLIPDRYRHSHDTLITGFGSENTSRVMGQPGSIAGIRASGEEFPIEASIAQTESGSGKLYTIILRDITDRKKAEAFLRQSLVRLQDLSRRLIETEETERRNINRELHDRSGQNLAALSINLATIRSGLSEETLRVIGKRLDDCQDLLQATSEQMRNVMAELRPLALDDYGLLAALRAYAGPYAERVGVSVDISGRDLDPRPPLFTESALFRITQEALNNIAKHARASRIDITLDDSKGRIVLGIRDDGVGFDSANAKTSTWGMATMRERAEAVGARLAVESAPGKGTRVSVTIGGPAS